MSADTDISALYREFTDALTEVLAENAGNPADRGWSPNCRMQFPTELCEGALLLSIHRSGIKQ
jgi:hypothetical protein